MPQISESLEDYRRRINGVYSMLIDTPNSSLPDATVDEWYNDDKAGDEFRLVQAWMRQNGIAGRGVVL